MIVKMKKIHVIVSSKDAQKALNTLRDLEILHIEHLSTIKGHPLGHQQEEISHMEKVLSALKPLAKDAEQTGCHDPRGKMHELFEWCQLIERLKENMARREARIQKWEPWGNFSPEDIERLEREGVFIRLYEIPVVELKNLPSGVLCRQIYKESGIARCAVVSESEPLLPFNRVVLPSVSLTEEIMYQREESQKLAIFEGKLKENACYVDVLCEHELELNDRLRFAEARLGMKEEEELAILKGFCPEKYADEFAETAQKQRWGFLIEDVTDEDRVPTMLENSDFVNLSKPAFDMIEILPGYGEVDVSRAFIFFFTLFFGMLIGDAAYGIIFGALTFIAQIKLKDKIKDKTPFKLMYLLTGFTIVWGVLTGTYFGQQWLPPSVSPVIPWLNDPENLQWLCFTIALAHLSVARFWSFLRKWPRSTALAQIGWLLIVWGMYFLANMFVLGHEFPAFAKYFFIVGIPLAFFFMVPFNEFLKKMPQELVPFMLGVIGAGTDIVSYIRLFAVGLATVAVADAANSMPSANLPGGLNYFLFIFLHLLNMVLAAMAILVHAIRLNVLEFSGHLGLEWAGMRYDPFRKNLKKA